jgi:deoxycytidylate deaminase
MKQKHGCVVVRGGSILSVGTNKFKNHPAYVHEFDKCSVHAEIDALSRVSDARGADIYVARINRAGVERLSRPCVPCYKRLHNLGIRKIVFTI